MSWFYEKETINSDKNGRVRFVKFLGSPAVFSGAWDQSTPYTNGMWADALKRLPKDFQPKKILLLGLGGGGVIPKLDKKFPRAKITVIEWDPVMIRLSKRILKPGLFTKLSIIEGDAEKAIDQYGNEFDLIILDLFKGHDVATAVSERKFIEKISNTLRRRGYFLANLFSEPQRSKLVEEYFLKEQFWKYKYNKLGIYRRKDWRDLPAGYVNYRSSAEFLKRDGANTRFKYIEAGEVPGTVADYGFIQVVKFIGDKEPQLTPKKFSFVIWQRTVRDDKVPGWKISWSQMGIKRNGFAEITNSSNYWANWDSHAKRQRTKWQKEKGTDWEIFEPTPEEFISAYKKTRFDRVLRSIFISMLRSKMEAHGNLVGLIGARRIYPDGKRGTMAAGFAYVDVPEIKQSYHLISFHNKEARASAAGTGLMDEWFLHAISTGIRFLDFCVIWAPGEDKSWKGFSKFKSQFDLTFVDHSKPLIKFLRKKSG